MLLRKTKRKKTTEQKTTTLTISILPEDKSEFMDFIGGRNQSEFVRAAIREKMKKESRKS